MTVNGEGELVEPPVNSSTISIANEAMNRQSQNLKPKRTAAPLAWHCRYPDNAVPKAMNRVCECERAHKVSASAHIRN